jgi:uncharacterized phiE125 gp8 family phage protein
MIGTWTLSTPPAAEPVTLAEIKEHLRIDGTAEDNLLTLYARMAREAVEAETWRALMPQTWTLYLPGWPSNGVITLPRPPLRSVTSVTYTSDAGVTATLPATSYRVDTASEPGRIVLAPGESWPTVALDSGNPIAVTFEAGYANANSVPWIAKAAILLHVGDLYLNREATGAPVELSPTIRRMINLLKVRA